MIRIKKFVDMELSGIKPATPEDESVILEQLEGGVELVVYAVDEGKVFTYYNAYIADYINI